MFDKSAEKIDGRELVLSLHVKACDFLGFVEYFFLKLPVARAKQLGRSMKKTTSRKKATDRVTQLDLIADWAEKYFSAQSAGRNSTTSGTGSVRVSSQGLFSS